MNQYELQNAAEKIEGYYVPRPGESVESAFNRARQEAINALKSSLANVQSLTLEQFRPKFFACAAAPDSEGARARMNAAMAEDEGMKDGMGGRPSSRELDRYEREGC